MKCSPCGADNPAGLKLCGQCGAALGTACPSCGAGNPPGHRFCGQCGAPLYAPSFAEPAPPKPNIAKPQTPGSVSTLPGEMRQVTVFFCDLVNSTPLTERLGAEVMRDLVHGFLETSLAQVRRYGGTAPQFTGDGFMALFGAPLTHEDHVRRALLAAVAIQRALDEAETADPEPSELTMRIGIHTGPVVFGPVADSLAMDYTVIGDTANVAARLQQAAEPGTILVSDETCRLAQGYARFDLSRSGRSSSKARPSRSRLIVCSRSPIAAWGCASRHRRAPRCLSIARASSRSGGTRSYAGVPFTD